MPAAATLESLVEGKDYILDPEKALKILRTHRIRAFVRAIQSLEEYPPLQDYVEERCIQTMRQLSLEELGLVDLIYSETIPQIKHIPYLIALDFNHEKFLLNGDDQFLWTYGELWASCGENPVHNESDFNEPRKYQELWRSVGIDPALVKRREDDGNTKS